MLGLRTIRSRREPYRSGTAGADCQRPAEGVRRGSKPPRRGREGWLSFTDIAGSPVEHAHCSTGANLNVIRTLSSCILFPEIAYPGPNDRARLSNPDTYRRQERFDSQKNDLELIVRVYAQGFRTLRTGPHFNLATQVADLLAASPLAEPNSHDSDEERGSLDSSADNTRRSSAVRVDTAPSRLPICVKSATRRRDL